RSPLRLFFLLIALVLACFALLSSVLATDLGSVVGGANTADGSGVLITLTTGLNNSGFGFQALNKDTVGSSNTGIGFKALFSNTSGGSNTAIGVSALSHNTIGSHNTATGQSALFNNTTPVGAQGGESQHHVNGCDASRSRLRY